MEVEGASVTQPPFRPMTSSAASPPMGLLVPGFPVRTNFTQVDTTKWSVSLSSPSDLPSPITTVNELVVFLLPEVTLPPTHGLLLYWQVHVGGSDSNTGTGFEVLGSLTPSRPSAIFRTGWSEHDQIASLMTVPPPPLVTVTIGVSLEPLGQVENIVSSATTASDAVAARRPLVAQKIATDLFNFMSSFDTGASANSTSIVVPKNIFERWWKRFEAKSRRDPNFFLKQE